MVSKGSLDYSGGRKHENLKGEGEVVVKAILYENILLILTGGELPTCPFPPLGSAGPGL